MPVARVIVRDMTLQAISVADFAWQSIVSFG